MKGVELYGRVRHAVQIEGLSHRAVSVWTVKGKAKDRRVLNYQGCDLWEFKNGLVHKKDTYWKIVQPDA